MKENTHTPDLLRAALELADRGWRVHPVRPNKKPFLFDWPKLATTDSDTIRQWWSGLYRSAMIGIAAGPASGVFVLDIDDGERGEATAAVVSLCDHQPYLIQSLCTRVFLEARRMSTRVISADIVEAAARLFVEDNEHFHTLWDFVGPKLGGTSRRQLLLTLIGMLAHGPDPVTLTLIERSLDDRSVDPTLGDPLGDDLAELRELELVKLIPSEREAVYALEVPLMGAWMRLHVDVDDVIRRTQRELERSAR